MRASTAVGLLFAGSMSIFGIFSTSKRSAQTVQAIEPVWVDGQQGVYSPSTGEFVPTTAWDYADVCDEIRANRAQAGIYGTPTTVPSGYGSSTYGSSGYYHNHHYYGSSFGSGYGGSGYSGSSSSGIGSSSSFGSSRGGIGGMGHAHGGGGE